MSAVKNTIDGEFVEEVINNTDKDSLAKGLLALTVTGTAFYILGKRKGRKEANKRIHDYIDAVKVGIEIGNNTKTK